MDSEKIKGTNSNFQKGLYMATVELILLSVVRQAGKPIYGYQIAKIIEKDNGQIPIIKLGTLYPILRALEKDGWLESHVDPSVTGPPRRYYRITEPGRNTLAQLKEIWGRTKVFVDDILTGEKHD